MKLPIIFASLVLVATLPLASAHGIRRNSQVALDPNLSNTIPNLSGPRLYYNGSGPTPNETTYSPLPDPLPRLSQSQLADAFFEDIVAIVNGSDFASNCTKCLAGAEIMHLAAITQPVSVFVDILIRVCNKYKSAFTLHAPTCEAQFSGLGGTGPYHAQLLQKMSLATGDHAALCYSGFKVCPQPTTIAINETRYFSAKPASAEIAPPPSGRTINMLHLSDWHLDPRYGQIDRGFSLL